VTKNLKGKKKR